MSEIPEIGVEGIPLLQIPSWADAISTSIPQTPPVTLEIGIPVIDMPGCVEAHPDAGTNKQLKPDDSKGVKVFCDAGMPSFNAIDYRPEEFTEPPKAFTPKIPPPIKKVEREVAKEEPTQQEAPPPPNITPKIPIVLPCPRPGSVPLGGLNRSQTKMVIGYKPNGTACETIYDPLPLTDVIGNHLPSTSLTATTLAIGAVGIFGGVAIGKPLGDIAVKKIVKPLLKKVKKKILKLLKKDKILSTFERRQEQRSLSK